MHAAILRSCRRWRLAPAVVVLAIGSTQAVGGPNTVPWRGAVSRAHLGTSSATGTSGVTRTGSTAPATSAAAPAVVLVPRHPRAEMRCTALPHLEQPTPTPTFDGGRCASRWTLYAVIDAVRNSWVGAESDIPTIRRVLPDQASTLATYADTGPVFGLAFDAVRGQFYSGARPRYGSRVDTPDPGQLYETPDGGGMTRPWARIDAGPRAADVPAVVFASGELFDRWGLGDLEIDDQASTLFAVNLVDRRLYRLALPDGTHPADRDTGHPACDGDTDSPACDGDADADRHGDSDADVRPDYFYLAPDGEDLVAIYQTIAVTIPCPAESFWGER